jgi:anthranilate phosphoribosyltransferase
MEQCYKGRTLIITQVIADTHMSFLVHFHHVAANQPLSRDQAHHAMSLLLQGHASEAQIAGFLVALKMRGETAQELAGFAQAMRDHMVSVDAGPGLVDTCGTGGDQSGTFNISTVAAIVMAGAGAKVAKHGNRSLASQSGSADVLEALGIRISLEPHEAEEAIRDIGLGFLYAPHLHPAMKHAQSVRRELKLRTAFNLLGPLANPARAEAQLIGAPSADSGHLMAQALHELGTRHSFVVHGHDGLDEISTTGPTQVFEVTASGFVKHVWMPADFGVPQAKLADLIGGDTAVNADLAREILAGVKGPRRDIVLVNASAGLVAGGIADDLKHGVRLAALAIDSGRAAHVLSRLQDRFPK